MGSDAFGNYIADLQPGPSLPGSYGTIRYGSGVPSSDLGRVGDGYVNLSNGDWYTRQVTGWELQMGNVGGSSIVQVIATADANPNTAVIVPEDPAKGALFTQDGADLTELWRWDVDAQAWVQVTGSIEPEDPEPPAPALAEDDLGSYNAGRDVDGLDNGTGWEVAYVSRGALEPVTDLFDTYTAGVDVGGLDSGILWNAAYASHDWKTALDNFDSYAASADLNGLNGGTDWNAAYASR